MLELVLSGSRAAHVGVGGSWKRPGVIGHLGNVGILATCSKGPENLRNPSRGSENPKNPSRGSWNPRNPGRRGL